ncbi:MAG: 6-carboxytetrahydropterin synthase [Planctomycetia bacterium]|nr:6-carboxytetrahydropterin synthase [Planctomycetia bacterium]
MKTYQVRVCDDGLFFSAAHFITFANGECESLHGHDFHVSVEVSGALQGDGGYVLDFQQFRNAMRDILRKLDHKILLPELNPHFILSVREKEVETSDSVQNWISRVGDWLTKVNDYDRIPSDDSAEEHFERERQMESHLARELGLTPTPQETSACEEAPFESLGAEVEVRFQYRRWIFPEEDCEILPLSNTTAELLADYLADQLRKHPILKDYKPDVLRVEVKESSGMIGAVTQTENA